MDVTHCVVIPMMNKDTVAQIPNSDIRPLVFVHQWTPEPEGK